MRSARLFVLAAASLLALALTAVAAGMRPGPVEDGTLSVRDGRATMQVRMKGGLIGRLARGTLTITKPRISDGTIVVRGADRRRSPNGRTTVYIDRNIRFRITDDRKFTVKVTGSKINLSAIGRGDGWIDGYGDPDKGVYFDGTYSLNGEAYVSLPDLREPILLAAVPAGE